jgi:hypothetical protein
MQVLAENKSCPPINQQNWPVGGLIVLFSTTLFSILQQFQVVALLRLE